MRLTDAAKLPSETLSRIVREGKGVMPAFRMRLSSQEIETVVQYVQQFRDSPANR